MKTLFNQFKTETGGEDWLELSCVVLWAKPDALYKRLEEMKNYAQHGKDALMLRLGATFEVQPTGYGTRGNFYPWVIKAEGFSFRVKASNSEGNRDGQSNLHVIATGSTCTELGGRAAWKRIKNLVQILGGRIVANKVSRLDVCADLPDVDVRKFGVALLQQHVVTQVRRASIYLENFETEGVKLGRGDIVCRGYCKTKEIKQKRDVVAQERMERIRWGGKAPEMSLRIEFQLRRKALKSLGVDSISDWFAKSGAVCAYLTHDWLRVTTTKPDKANRNQGRAVTVDWWRDVVEAFNEWAGRMSRAARTTTQGAMDMEALTQSGVGCFLSALSVEVGAMDDPEEIAAEIAVRVADYIKDNPEKVRKALLRKCVSNAVDGKMRLVGAA